MILRQTKTLGLNVGLRWLLIASLSATGIALWWTPRDNFVDAIVVSKIPEDSRALLPENNLGRLAPEPLASSLPKSLFPEVQRDIFVAVQEPPPKQLLAPTLPIVIPQTLVSPVQEPVLHYRFLGRMAAPDGSKLTYLVFNENVLAASVGMVLPGGFRIDTIDDHQILLTHDSTGSKTKMPLGIFP